MIQSSGDKFACNFRGNRDEVLGSICEKYFQITPKILYKSELVYL